MAFQHEALAESRWRELSLLEQLGNIGSEVSRALRARGRDEGFYQSAFYRALELMDLTLHDSRWRGRLKELARAREMLCDAFSGGKEYKTKLEDLDHYFFLFALAARKNK